MKNQFTFTELSTPHGRNNWRVEGILNGKRKRSFYRTQELAERAARKFNLELEREGHRHADIPSAIRAEALACVERLSRAGGTLTMATNEWLAHHDLRAKSITVAQAWEQFVEYEKLRVAGLRGDRIRQLTFQSNKGKVARFVSEFGAEQLCDLTPKRIAGWLDALSREDGNPLQLGSKIAYRLALSCFFSHCVTQEWIAVHPIKAKIKAYRDNQDKQPGIFVAGEAAKLLEVADSDILPVIAIGLFAGLRPTEIWRLTWSDIIWHKNQIDVHGAKSKTGRYRFVTIPANLVEWLCPYRNASGKIWKPSQNNMNKYLRKTAKLAGIAAWPKDGLRHSFGSHHYGAYNNAALTAKEMGHEDTKMLFKHYNNRRSPEEGAAYFGIRPVEVPQILAAA